jgi:hypothetical protein
MDSKGKGKSPVEPKLAKEKVTGKSLALFISYLQGLQVGTSSSESRGSGEFQLFPLTRSRIGTQGARGGVGEVLDYSGWPKEDQEASGRRRYSYPSV